MTVLDRFMAKVEQTDGCWNWRGARAKGYGRFRLGGRNVLAHRFAYEHFVGTIPEGLTIDHLCRNRACVNPAHLEPVTNRENILRGDGACARNARKTRCPKGHEFETRPNGQRRCPVCSAERYRVWHREYMRERRRAARAAA